jgi:hypothetical protein
LSLRPSAATGLRRAGATLAAVLATAGFSFSAPAQSCADATLRMTEDFQAKIVNCYGYFIEARGDHFKLSLQAAQSGPYWYQPVRAYFEQASAFDGTSDWGEEQDAARRFDYATFRGDLLDDNAGVLSCVAITRHSSPYMGRGFISLHLIAGFYCDDSYGEAPIPDARINEIIDAIEFDFE